MANSRNLVTREVHELAVSVQYFQSFRHSRKDRYFVDRNRQFVDLPRTSLLSRSIERMNEFFTSLKSS